MELYDRIVNPDLLVRRINVVAARLLGESEGQKRAPTAEQLSIFDPTVEVIEAREAAEQQALDREKKVQRTVIDIKKKYGKNAILKGMNLQEGATGRDRNRQIGGHHE